MSSSINSAIVPRQRSQDISYEVHLWPASFVWVFLVFDEMFLDRYCGVMKVFGFVRVEGSQIIDLWRLVSVSVTS